jgi:hypothetical protein
MPVLDRTVPYNLDYQIPHRRLTEFGQRGVRSRPRFGARRAALTAGAAGQHGLTRAIRLLRKSAHLLDGDGQSPIVHLWVSVGFLSQLRFKLPINPGFWATWPGPDSRTPLFGLNLPKSHCRKVFGVVPQSSARHVVYI